MCPESREGADRHNNESTVLNENEIVESTIEHRNYLPYRMKDFLFVLVLIIGIIAAFEGLLAMSFVLLVICSYFLLFRQLIRRARIRKRSYLLTNQRLIVCDKTTDTVLFSFSYDNFPEMTVFENSFNTGYIILGEPEPDFIPYYDLFRIGQKINLKDNEFTLDSLPEVRKVHKQILNRVSEANK